MLIAFFLKAFQSENTPRQNEQCLRNFDLSEYRQVLSDIAVWIYQGVIKIMEIKVQQLIGMFNFFYFYVLHYLEAVYSS